MDLIQIRQGLQQLGRQAHNIYIEYADAKADYDSMDDQKKTFLAAIEMKYEGKQAEITRQALADDDYIDFLNKLAERRSKYLTALSAKQSLETRLMVYQSLAKCYLQDHINSQS